MKFSRILALVATSLLLLSASACVERVVEREPGRVVYVASPPPQEIVEVVPAQPGPNWVWQKGHWRWDGNRYYWVRGHWAPRPQRYNVWVAPHWEPHPHGWFFIEGHWQ